HFSWSTEDRQWWSSTLASLIAGPINPWLFWRHIKSLCIPPFPLMVLRTLVACIAEAAWEVRDTPRILENVRASAPKI
ncbi:hypothetical protein NPIL_631661, partial [Nephila pilipes]